MGYKRSDELLQKYIDGNCTPEEVAIVESWYNSLGVELNDPEIEPDYARIHQRLAKRLPVETPVVHIWKRIAAAAVLLVCLSAGYYFLVNPMGKRNKVANSGKHTISPGGNRAVLTLANGKQIILTNASKGTLARESNTAIDKTANGQISYVLTGKELAQPAAQTYNTITTPRGGQFAVVLSDGTKVILNAASSLKYPARFSASERKVELTGEGYFEVTPDRAKPFRVESKGQTVEVLGTHFNINTYVDEPAVKTTLLEGSVKITNKGRSAVLKPGEQATVMNDVSGIQIREANTSDAVAWTKGLFTFHDTELTNVMRQLARWYDVDIVYEGNVKQRSFSGKIHRNLSAEEALDILKFAKVNFSISGRKITITP